MDRGWGLTLDSSDRYFNHAAANSAMFSGTGFPVVYKDEPAGSSPNREVDFFNTDSVRHSNLIVKKETPSTPINIGLHLVTVNTGSDESTIDDGISSNSTHELARLQEELGKMKTENERLRGMLSQVSNNYNTLQMQMVTLMQQRQQQQQNELATNEKDQVRQFIDLGPSGAAGVYVEDVVNNNDSSSDEKTRSASPLNNEIVKRINGREETPESESWIPNKTPKLSSPTTTAAKSVDQASDATMRKARVSVRARSEAPMITDGCQWRKYGQKMAKGNPCPRAYYRCTMAVGCPVRKQVQRCAEDRTILITTYEGNHNHPLPPAAMAMASTTSAAANMLLSGSMSSADGLMNPNFLARAIFPSNTSMATISASAPFPTVTLDLTQSPNPLRSQAPSPIAFGQPLYNQSQFSGLQMSQNFDSTQRLTPPPPLPLQPSFADTLSAATAAITSNPNFTAALAAAITSIMSGNSQTNNNNNNNNDGTDNNNRN
jgi:hypothetical protein